MSVFGDTQVQQVASSVTPQQAIVDNRLAEALQSTAGVATAGLGILSDLQASKSDAAINKFSQTLGNISQAFHQDPSKRTSLRAQATKAFDQFVSGGGDAQEARKVWNAVIGSGGGSGKSGAGLAQDFNLFAETPQEQAKGEFELRVEELITSAGLSPEDATLLAQQENREKLAKQFQPRNEAELAAKYQSTLASTSTQFAINLDGLLRAGGGAIDDNLRREMLLAIDQQEALVKADLAIDAKPTPTRFYSPEMLRAEEDRISSTFDNFRSMVNSRGDLEVLTRATETATLREKQLAQENFRTIRILNQAGGQAYVDSYMEAQRYSQNSALNAYWMDQIDPIARVVAGNAGTQAELSLGIYGKAVSGDKRVNPFEADLAAKLLASQPSGSKLGEALVVGASDNPVVSQNLTDIGYADPQAVEKVFTQDAMRRLITTKGQEGYKATLTGVKSRVVQSILSSTGGMPSGYINVRIDPRGRFYVDMANSDRATVNNVKSLYRMLEANPNEVKELSEQAGRELSIEEALNFSLGIPLDPINTAGLPQRVGRGSPRTDKEPVFDAREAATQFLEALTEGGEPPKRVRRGTKRRAGGTQSGVGDDFLSTLSDLIKDPEFMEKSSEEKLEELEGMGFDGSVIRTSLGDLFGGGPDQE